MKVSIIGAGNVGSACGFAILHKVKPETLVITDINTERAKGEALDLAHSTKSKVFGGDISLIKDSDYVVITAGKPRDPNMTREELLEINSKIVSNICESINLYAPNAKVLMVTNPSTKLAKLYENAIDIGLYLDTARLHYYLKQEGIENPKSFVKGEHGENMEFVIRDGASKEVIEKVKKLVCEAGSDIIKLKGYTNWGIASQVARLINSGDAW